METSSFIFDDVTVTPGQQIGAHSHPIWELSHVIRGSGTRVIGDSSCPIREGEVILLPPGIRHIWRFDSDSGNRGHNDAECHKVSNISLFFSPRLLGRLALTLPELAPCIDRIKSTTEALSYTGPLCLEIASRLCAMRGLTALGRLPGFIGLLPLIAETEGCLGAGSATAMSHSERKMEAIRIFCSCNFSRDASLSKAASFVGMNKSSLCTFMRRHTGMTYSEYLNSLRLDKACEMLRLSDSSISTIAYDVGFSNVTYFNRLFRLRHNCTPKEFRNKQCDNKHLPE